jgi:hypothetical protein
MRSKIEDFISENEDMSVEVSPGVSYNLRDVINENYRLYNAKFASGNTEESGFNRIFMRKLWVVYRTLIQGSDIDLKHLNVRSLNGAKIRLASMFKMATVSHLSRTFFGEFIDDVLSFMCWHGSAITKRVDGEVENVDLRNYITEANIQKTQDRRHCELVYYSYDEMKSNKEAWKDNWDSVETNWEAMQNEGESQFKVLEFWTWDTIGEDKEIHKVCIKYLDNTITEKDNLDNPTDWEAYVELERFKTPYSRKRTSKRQAKRLGEFEELFPYNQFDLFKVPGRALAMGC